MIGAGLGVLGIRLKFRTMIGIASIYGLLVYGIRQFYIINKIPFGTHTYILIICFMLLLILLGKQRFFSSLVASLVSLFLLTIGDGIILLPLLNYLKINPVVIVTKPGGLLLAGLISNILLITTYIITYISKVQFINIDTNIRNKV